MFENDPQNRRSVPTLSSDAPLHDAADNLVQLASLAARAPMALIAVQQRDGTWSTVDIGICCSRVTMRGQSYLDAVFQRIMAGQKPVIVRDVGYSREDSAPAWLDDLDVAAWAAVPLICSNECSVGVICVFDTAPRDWTDEEIQGLNHVAALFISVTELSATASNQTSTPVENSSTRSHSQHEDNVDAPVIFGGDKESLNKPDRQSMTSPVQSEQRYRSLFDFNLNAVFEFDSDGNFVDANPACEALTGYSAEELRQMSFTPLIVPEELEKAEQIFRSALSGTPQDWDLAIRRRDGQRRELHGTSVPMVIDDEIVGVFGVAQDVTDRNRAESVLRETEAALRFQQSLLVAQGEASADGFMVVSEEGAILSYNQRLTTMLGIPEEIMRRGSILDARNAVLDKLVDPEEFVQRALYLYEHPDEECHDEVELNDGRIFDRHSAPVRDSDGAYFGRVWYYRDVTDQKQAERQLFKQTGRLDSLVSYNPDLVATLDFQGVFRSVNTAFAVTLGYLEDDLIGEPFTVIVDSKDHASSWNAIAQLANGEAPSLELTVHRKDGHTVELSVQGIPIILDGDIMGFWAIGKDITEAKQVAMKLQQSESSLADAQRIAGIGSWEWDLRTNLLNWSEGTYRVLGFSPDRVRPTLEMFMEVVHPDDRRSVEDAIAATLHDGAPYDIDIVITFPDGEERCINAQGEVTFDQYGTPVKMAGTVLDITERKRLEQELAYRADHDPLTGLVNRHRLFSHIEHILADPDRPSESSGLLFIDLDDFKAVNDSLGHDAGDELLTMAAERLLGAVRENDTVARLGGDEFVVLLEHITDQDEAVQVAERIMSSLQQPFSIQGATVSISPSVGIVPSIPAQESPETVLQDADMAMYRAKKQGKARYEVFTPIMHRISHDRIELQNQLREAVEQESFTLDYQPMIRLDTGEPIGSEALLRWNSPVLGSISPAEFIPIAERCGLINPIGQWVIREAGRQVNDWNGRMSQSQRFVMCINLSPMQLRQRDFIETFVSILQERNLDPQSLCFEITETAIVAQDGVELDNLRALRDLGVKLAIDDFGTGQSSLAYLKDLPVNWLKVDRSFVDQLGRQSANNSILSAIIQLAHALNLEVIAEGVETAEQLDIARALGCDMAQGYYVAIPASDELTFRYLIDIDSSS